MCESPQAEGESFVQQETEEANKKILGEQESNKTRSAAAWGNLERTLQELLKGQRDLARLLGRHNTETCEENTEELPDLLQKRRNTPNTRQSSTSSDTADPANNVAGRVPVLCEREQRAEEPEPRLVAEPTRLRAAEDGNGTAVAHLKEHAARDPRLFADETARDLEREILRPVDLRLARRTGEELRAVDDGFQRLGARSASTSDMRSGTMFATKSLASDAHISVQRHPRATAVSTAQAMASAFGSMLFRRRASSVHALVSASSVFARFFAVCFLLLPSAHADASCCAMIASQSAKLMRLFT